MQVLEATMLQIEKDFGKGSIIGANSVVTKDIPECAIAVGNPAKVIKKFNAETKRWEKSCGEK